MNNKYKTLIHRVLENGKILTTREVYNAIRDLPALDEGKLKARKQIPVYSSLAGMLANNKYGCVRANGKYDYPAKWKLKEE